MSALHYVGVAFKGLLYPCMYFGFARIVSLLGQKRSEFVDVPFELWLTSIQCSLLREMNHGRE